jgi:hypothetical protein
MFSSLSPAPVKIMSPTYTLRAVDLNKFNINAESGVVTYKITPNVVPATPDNIVITATNIAGNTVKVGFVVSTLTDKTLEVELVLPSASVALAVISVVVFSAKVTFLLKFPLSSAVVVPNESTLFITQRLMAMKQALPTHLEQLI